MASNSGDLSAFLTKCIRREGITITELAKRCGLSRATLYRYLRGDSALGDKGERAVSEALHLCAEEQKTLRLLASGGVQTPAFQAAYASVRPILFRAQDMQENSALQFAYYTGGEKYLRTAEEVCATLASECNMEGVEIRISAVNCLDGSMAAFLHLLTATLFGASPFVSMEHLVSFSEEGDARAAATLRQMLALLRYDDYHALYLPSGGGNAENAVYVEMRYPAAASERIHYVMDLYASGLCQCLRYDDAALQAFFCARYEHIRADYEDSLLYLRNIQAVNQELAEFESSGSISLFKPDPCYNEVPPEAYASLLSRMTEMEKIELFKAIFGRKVTRVEMKTAVRDFLASMAQRFENTRAHPYRLICCRDGLLNFMRTGLLTGNLANLPAFSLPEREMILQSLRDRIAAIEGTTSVLIVIERILTDGAIISVNRDKGILIDFGGARQVGFSQNVMLRHAGLAQLLSQYAYSDELAALAYSQDAALQFIDGLLKRTKK